MDLNRDEMRRELHAIDAANKAAMPKWYDALRRIVGGGTSMSTDEKAALLGVPSPGRRHLFKMGGATILGAAVLAACGSDDDDTSSASSSTTAMDSGDGDAASESDMDLPLARTAASLEKLAVDTYQVGIDSGLVTTAAIGDAAKLFQEHHQTHLDALNGVISGAGGAEVTEQNEAVFKALVEPAVGAATTEADIVMLAYDLESAAAQTYAFAGGALSVPELRSTIMTIGGIEVRHAAVLQVAAMALSPLDVFPDGRAFYPGDNPLADIEGAVLTA